MKTLLCNILCHHHQLLIIQLATNLQVYSFTVGEEREEVSHKKTVSKIFLAVESVVKCLETNLLKLQWYITFCTYSIEELSKAHHLITNYEHKIISVSTISNH